MINAHWTVEKQRLLESGFLRFSDGSLIQWTPIGKRKLDQDQDQGQEQIVNKMKRLKIKDIR